MKIYKFPVQREPLYVPGFVRALSVANQPGAGLVWWGVIDPVVELDPDVPAVRVEITEIMTGEEVGDLGACGAFLGTVQEGPVVSHVFWRVAP